MHEKVNAPPVVIRFGPFTLDGRSGELRNGPTRLKVPDQSIAVLQALLERPGELVTREALRDRLWGPDTFVDFEAGLNAAVRRLREALNDSADAPRYVETLPRRGYRFIAPVEGASATPATAGTRLGGCRGSDLRPFRNRPDRASPPASRGARDPRAGAHRRGTLGRFAMEQSDVDCRRPCAGRPHHQFPRIGARSGNLSNGQPRRVRLGRRRWRQLRHLRPIDRWQLAAASDDRCRGRPCARVVARRSTDCVRACPGWKARDYRDAGAWRSRAAACSRQGRNVGLVQVGSLVRALVDAGRQAPGLRRSDVGAGPTSAIYLYSFEDGQRRQLTRPPANLGDIHPVVSPDGRYLAFVRRNTAVRRRERLRAQARALQPRGSPSN